MSRLAKASRKSILTTQPPKPSNWGHHDHTLGEEITSDYLHAAYSVSSTTVSERSSRSEEALEQDFYFTSEVQRGAARLVQHLYDKLKAEDEAESPSRNQLGSIPAPQCSQPSPSMPGLLLARKKKCFRPKAFTELPLETEEEEDLGSLVGEDHGAISPEVYLHQLFEWGRFEDDVILVAFILVERALMKEKRLRAKHLHKLIAGCILLAHKYLNETSYWRFADFGDLTGVKALEVEKIENVLLVQVFDFQLYVNDQEHQEATLRLRSKKY